MHALLHTLGAVVVVPYVALAMLFLFIGQAARAKGLWALVEVLWNHVDWYLGWVIYAAPVLWLGLVAAGFVPPLQRAGSLGLCLLAAGSFLVIVALSAERVGLGELLFLLPCAAVAATSAWLCWRAGTLAPISVD